MAKKQKKPKKPRKSHTYYKVSGESIERVKKTCPKCGIKSFLAEHKDRLTCGKCGYMEKKTKEKA